MIGQGDEEVHIRRWSFVEAIEVAGIPNCIEYTLEMR